MCHRAGQGRSNRVFSKYLFSCRVTDFSKYLKRGRMKLPSKCRQCSVHSAVSRVHLTLETNILRWQMVRLQTATRPSTARPRKTQGLLFNVFYVKPKQKQRLPPQHLFVFCLELPLQHNFSFPFVEALWNLDISKFKCKTKQMKGGGTFI